MNPQFDRLLQSLTQVFRRDKLPVEILTIGGSIINGSFSLSLSNHTLTIAFAQTGLPVSPFDCVIRDFEFAATLDASGNMGQIVPVETVVYDLRRFTLEALVDDINRHQGLTATIIDQRYRKLLAAALIDGIEPTSIQAPIVLTASTNPLWITLKPLAFAIEDHENSIDTALAQLNILTATKYFADFWGRFLGIPRESAEADIDYMQRIVDSILLQRINNIAIEAIIKSELGLDAEVVDLLPDVLNINNSEVFSVIPGEVYNVGNFLVKTILDGDGIIELVNRHKAGGTRAFFSRVVDQGFVDGMDPAMSADFYDVSLFDTFLRPEQEMRITMDIAGQVVNVPTGVPNWIVGVTPMPGTIIGP
jgi:hypothetical protein